MSRVGAAFPPRSLQLPVASPSPSRTDLRRASVINQSALQFANSHHWDTARSEDPDDDDDELTKTRYNRASKVQKAREVAIENQKTQEKELRDFISAHFHRKECCQFVEDREGKCKCGEVRDRHDPKVLRKDAGSGWSEQCLVKVDGPTNAFGRITLKNEGFDNREPIHFVRLCDEDDMDRILDLMKKYWKMAEPPQPSLCISVIGGAKNFKLEGRKKEVFHQGLIRAAQTTNAWIITSGLNLGITRVVGNALEEGRSSHWEKSSRSSKLRCIGVAPWGYVLNRDQLLNSADKKTGEISMDVEYKISNVISKGQPVSLNASHTHYLLVDDGKRNRYGGSKSAVIKAKLQQQINKKEKIPVVLLIVEGGLDIFEDARSMIEEQIPIVTCDSTGRAADIIATAFKKMQKSEKKELSEGQIQDLRDRMVVAFRENLVDPKQKKINEKKLDENMEHLLRIVQDEEYITVFDMNRSDDLDLAILSALLKVMKAKKLDDYKKQLHLSLTWDRADIAAEKIFTEEHQWDTKNLEDFAIEAIEQDKIEFLKLFLKNGLIMREFLDVKRLKHMYQCCLQNQKSPAAAQVKKLLVAKTDYDGRGVVRLVHVRLLLRKLIGKFRAPIMDEDAEGADGGVEDRLFDRPFNQLFFWAVLFCRQTIAEFLWERTDEAVPLALAACKIYDEMAKAVPSHHDSRRRALLGHKEKFEDLAVRVIEECQVVDPPKAEMLIEKHVEAFGDFNCLELAASANCKRFLSCNSSQNSITSRWLNGLLHGTTNFRIFVCVLLPLLVPTDLLVRLEKGIQDESEGVCERTMNKVRIFYTAPVTKFFANTICYVFFLFLYSWFILFELKQTYISWLEWIVIAWIGVMIVEEVREMFASKADSVKEKLRDWWGFSVWNRLDVVTVLFALVSIVLRGWTPSITDDMFKTIRTFYILAGVLFYLRVFRLYYANSYLGPKLVMINKMVKELMFYMSILFVALLTYGIASQALLYPSRTFLVSIFKDVLYYPYWQVYGEIYLEVAEAQAEGCNGTTTHDREGNLCPQEHFLVPLLLAVYLIVVNVLLLNLLIAIFSNIFQDIEKNSIEVWKFNMYFLVHEYYTRPVLAVPFVIFEDVFRFLRLLLRLTPCCRPDSEGSSSRRAAEQPDSGGEDMRRLSSHCLLLVHSRLDSEQKAEVGHRIQLMWDRLDDLYKMCDRIDERFEDEMLQKGGEELPRAASRQQQHQQQQQQQQQQQPPPPIIVSVNEDVNTEKPGQFKELPAPSPRSLTAAADGAEAAAAAETAEATSKRKRRHRKQRRSRSRHSDDEGDEGRRQQQQQQQQQQLNISRPEDADERLEEMERRLSSMEAATTHSLTSIERLLRQILKDRPPARQQ